MSRTFTKLFSSITESTVWCEPDRTRLAWITMLAMADRNGRVWASIPGLANRARIPVEDARAAIDTFLAPDPDSRTPDHDGRRIEPIDGGWRLLNHEKYRAIRDEESTKEAKRNYINARRAKEREAADLQRSTSSTVEHGRDNAEADTEAEAVSNPLKGVQGGKPPARKRASPSDLSTVDVPNWVPAERWTEFVAMRRAMRGVPFTEAAARGVIAELGKLRQQGHDPGELLTASVTNGWRSVFAPKATQAAQKSFAQQEREAGMSRWEQMTGKAHPDRQTTLVIDNEPSGTSN